MSIWNMLENVLRRSTIVENRQFRGNSGMRLKDLHKLLVGDDKRPGVTGRAPNPNGEAVDGGKYAFSPKIWGPWLPSMGAALAIACSDQAGSNHHGAAQGVHAVKNNYGGKVTFAGGKAKTDFERRGSAMDTYDVVMTAEINGDQGTLLRLAYSPSIGSMEERSARLQGLFRGETVGAPARRPQPHVPEPEKAKEMSAKLLAIKAARDAEEKATPVQTDQGSRDGSALTGNDGWKAKLAAHDKAYTPQNKNRNDTPDVDRMFDPDDLPPDNRPPKRHR